MTDPDPAAEKLLRDIFEGDPIMDAATDALRSLEPVLTDSAIDDVAADVVAAVTPLIRAQTAGPCICNGNPATTQGPEEDCPQHGRPYAYWVEAVGVLQQRLAAVLELADHTTRETAGGQQ